jgi:2-methylcitrate dehydratase
VALQDGSWHHVDSYLSTRSRRPDTVELWHKISTVEDPEWSRRYLTTDPAQKAFGGWVQIFLTDGTTLTQTIVVPDAHPLGARPFVRENYVKKFRTLSADVLAESEIERFLDVAQSLESLSASDLSNLTFRARAGVLESVVEPEGLI